MSEIGPIAKRAYNGEATYIDDFPLVVDRFGKPEQAWFTFCYSPLRLSDGTVAGMMTAIVETTKTVRTRGDLDLLNNELGHRLKNTLALVQAIAEQTLADVPQREPIDAFRDRLRALGHAHDVLLRQSWASASLGRSSAKRWAARRARADRDFRPRRAGDLARIAFAVADPPRARDQRHQIWRHVGA